MKSKLFIILLASVAFGCSEFLEETSQTEIRPSTVSDMEKILESEAYFSGAEAYMFNRGTDIFTDDMQSNALPENTSLLTVKESWRYRFTWDATMFNESGGGEDLTFWSLPYERINRCNLVLEYIDDMEKFRMQLSRKLKGGQLAEIKAMILHPVANDALKDFFKKFDTISPTKELYNPSFSLLLLFL